MSKDVFSYFCLVCGQDFEARDIEYHRKAYCKKKESDHRFDAFNYTFAMQSKRPLTPKEIEQIQKLYDQCMKQDPGDDIYLVVDEEEEDMASRKEVERVLEEKGWERFLAQSLPGEYGPGIVDIKLLYSSSGGLVLEIIVLKPKSEYETVRVPIALKPGVQFKVLTGDEQDG